MCICIGNFRAFNVRKRAASVCHDLAQLPPAPPGGLAGDARHVHGGVVIRPRPIAKKLHRHLLC